MTEIREPVVDSSMSDGVELLYDAAVDGLESLILGHACAGIDIESPEYMEGIETAVEAIGNHF